MSGGLRTSVKSDIIAKRVTEALEINTVNENETSINVTSNSTAADSVVHPPRLSVPEMSMASASYGFNICDGNIPCLPMLSSAAKSMGTTTRAESPPRAEINYLGRLRHPNLVKLIGYCSQDDGRLLVYEFMPCGSLDNHLFRSHLTAKCDVYGFGVVMLEMLSGKRAVDSSRPTGEHNLVEWAKPYLVSEHRVVLMIDACVEGQYSVASALKAADLPFLCLSADPKLRPNMNDVVKTLEQLQESGEMENPRPSQNEPRQNPHAISSNGPKRSRRSINGTNNLTTAAHSSRPAASHRNT